jgi:hypothetical protein
MFTYLLNSCWLCIKGLVLLAFALVIVHFSQNVIVSLNHLSCFVVIVVLGRGTLWYLQIFSQYIK